jgi:hypothetical protein
VFESDISGNTLLSFENEVTFRVSHSLAPQKQNILANIQAVFRPQALIRASSMLNTQEITFHCHIREKY